MTDHHDFGFDDHDPFGHDPGYETPEHAGWDDPPEHDLFHDHLTPDTHDPTFGEPADTHAPAGDEHDDPFGWDQHTTAGDDDHAGLVEDPVTDVFPPAVDVGPLPEPVDGFPWADSGSLGLADITAALHDTVPVQPSELAEYAATDLPPGEDPWAALADSDDPATAALAKWWTQN
jgi:hypothetical protein